MGRDCGGGVGVGGTRLTINQKDKLWPPKDKFYLTYGQKDCLSVLGAEMLTPKGN